MRSIITLALAASAASLAAQLQNGGFEVLDPVNMPTYWTPGIELIVIDDSVVVDSAKYLLNSTDVHSGQHAAELRNSYNYTQDLGSAGVWYSSPFEEAYGGFPSPQVPVVQRPLAIRFWAKYAPVNGDLGYAEVTVLSEGTQEIGTGSLTISATSDYTEFVVPINYVLPDSAAYIGIRFTTMVPNGNPHLGTRMLVDDVSVDYTLTGVDDALTTPLRLFPNPAADVVHVTGLSGTAYVRILDAIGRVHHEGMLMEGTIPVHTLSAGSYSVEITTNGIKMQQRLMVTR